MNSATLFLSLCPNFVSEIKAAENILFIFNAISNPQNKK